MIYGGRGGIQRTRQLTKMFFKVQHSTLLKFLQQATNCGGLSNNMNLNDIV